MSAGPVKPLHPQAIRCEPYSDGPWLFAYDPAHVDALRDLGAHDVLLDFAAGQEADARLQRIAEEGLALAAETGMDPLVVDVLVGRKLGAAQKKSAQWVDRQGGFLRVTSGTLRIDSLNTLGFGPDEPDGEGCEVGVPPGDYDVVLHRVAWELMDVESMEERPELPTVVLELSPVGKKGAKVTGARLTLADAQGELGAWLAAARMEDGLFLGSTRADPTLQDGVLVNLRPAHAESMGLRFGSSLDFVSGQARTSVPFLAFLTTRGVRGYLGPDFWERHFGASEIHAGFSLLHGSPPWLLEVDGAGLPPGVDVAVSVGEPWCEAPDDRPGEWSIEKGVVTARVVRVSRNGLILNVGPDETRKAGFGPQDPLELTVGGETRPAYPSANREVSQAMMMARMRSARGETPAPSDGGPAPLMAGSLSSWDDPERRLLFLETFGGIPHGIDAAPGEEAVLRAAPLGTELRLP